MSHSFIEITDFHAPELDIYARLTETQLRSHHGIENSLFIAESPHVIERALEGGCEPESLLMLPKMPAVRMCRSMWRRKNASNS